MSRNGKKHTSFDDKWLKDTTYELNLLLLKGSTIQHINVYKTKERTLGDMGKSALKNKYGTSSSSTSSTSLDPIPSLFHQSSSDEAYIIWAHCVKYSYSDNSVNDFGSVLKPLCPNSKIAGNFQMGRKKHPLSRSG